MEAGHSTVRATVRALEGGIALVEVEQGGCGRCHEKGGCGGQNLTQMLCTSPKVYRAENRIGAAVGERGLIDIESGSVRASANLAYGVPLLACVLGAVEQWFQVGPYALVAAAWIIAVGSALTCVTRTQAVAARLRAEGE